MKKFVTFYLGERLFGFDIRVVKEINTNVDIYPVPRCEKHIRGLVNIRGQVALVLDIAIILGMKPCVISDDSKIIIFKTKQDLLSLEGISKEIDINKFGDKPVGVIVDKIGEVVAVEASQVEPPPRHLDEKNARYFDAVIRLDKQLLAIFDAAEML